MVFNAKVGLYSKYSRIKFIYSEIANKKIKFFLEMFIFKNMHHNSLNDYLFFLGLFRIML